MSSPPSTLIHRTLGRHADAARRHHQLAFLVAVFRDAFAERQLAGALAFLLPGLADLRLHRQHVAGTRMAVIFVMLLGMQPTHGAGLALDAARRLGGAEPGLAGLRAQMVLG